MLILLRKNEIIKQLFSWWDDSRYYIDIGVVAIKR
jgi:hypothetical protein